MMLVGKTSTLLLNFKNGKKTDWTLENLEMICYNCYFLYIGDIYNKKQVRAMEDYTAPTAEDNSVDWELDDYYKEHLQNLGIIDNNNETDPGSEFVSKV